MNNKGYTMIELLITITLTISLVFALIVIPTYLLKNYKDYDKLAQYTSEISIVKSALTSDLESTIVKEIDEDSLQIGKNTYNFESDGLYKVNKGNSIKLSDQALSYEIIKSEESKVLNIYNDNTNLEFSIKNSSFDLREWNEMRNDKGFATIGVVVAVLIATMIVISIFLNPILNTTVNMKESKEIIPKYVNNISGMERLYSVFKENISHNQDLTFEDIEKDYSITEKSSDYSQVELVVNGNNDTFYVNNKTDIDISFKVVPIDSELPHSYNIDLVLNNSESVASKENLSNDASIEIPEDFLYNEDTGETNYGYYSLSINAKNANVLAKINYSKLEHREINIKNNNIEQVLSIDNSSKDENVEIYFIQ